MFAWAMLFSHNKSVNSIFSYGFLVYKPKVNQVLPSSKVSWMSAASTWIPTSTLGNQPPLYVSQIGSSDLMSISLLVTCKVRAEPSSRWQWGISRRGLTHHPRPRGGEISPSPSPRRPLGNIFLPSPFPAGNWSPMGIPVPDTKQDKGNRTISMTKTWLSIVI